jgi:hypothetical protein
MPRGFCFISIKWRLFRNFITITLDNIELFKAKQKCKCAQRKLYAADHLYNRCLRIRNF